MPVSLTKLTGTQLCKRVADLTHERDDLQRKYEELVITSATVISELQGKVEALAVENVTARNAVQAFCDVVQSNTDAICEEVGQEGVKAILAAMSATGNMTATDAALAEVRAQGADECVRLLVTSDDDDFSDAPNICAMVAQQLRKEAEL